MRKTVSLVVALATTPFIVGCGGGNSGVESNIVEKNSQELNQANTQESVSVPTVAKEESHPTQVVEEVGIILDDNPLQKEILDSSKKKDKEQIITLAKDNKVEESTKEDDKEPKDDKVKETTSETDTASKAVEDKKDNQIAKVNTNREIRGVVIDGPIYGAEVKIVDANDSSLVLATTTSDKDGGYSAKVENLPEVYRVVISDGKDSGVDGVVDKNDKELPFRMSARVKRDDRIVEDGVMPLEEVNISPATTVVDRIVEDGAMPLEEANKAVSESFGIDDSVDLAKMDNRKHKLSNKLSNLIAFLAKITPVEDKNIAITSISKLVIKKEIRVKLSDTSTDLDDLNLSLIADEASNISPLSISPEDIAKLDLSQDVLKLNLSNLIESVNVVSEINQTQRYDLLAQRMALFELIKEVDNSTIDEIDSSSLELLSLNTQDILKSLLESSSFDEIDDDNVDFVSQLVKENLDKDSSEIKSTIIKASKSYRLVVKRVEKNSKIDIRIRLKKMIKYIYKNSDISSLDTISKSLNDDKTIDSLATLSSDIGDKTIVESGEIKDSLDDELVDLSAGVIANEIMEKKSISISKIESIKSDTIDNKLLVETIKTKVKIKITIKKRSKTKRLSREDTSKLISSKVVIKNIKSNVKTQKFTQTTKESSEALYNESLSSLQKSIDELKEKIEALKILIFNLHKKFDREEFTTTTTKTIKIIKEIKVDGGSSRVKTIVTIKQKIKKDYKLKVKITDSISVINESVDEYKKPIKHTKKTITLPQPKLSDMPEEFITPIKIAI